MTLNVLDRVITLSHIVQNIWKARCVGQWKVPAFLSSPGWRALHVELVRCLTLVDGSAQACGGAYDNVIAIVEVLDTFRTLAEMARACFGRLCQLLDTDETREATKCVDWRIMEHALWTLKAYPEDVDIQLVSQRLFLRSCEAGSKYGTYCTYFFPWMAAASESNPCFHKAHVRC